MGGVSIGTMVMCMFGMSANDACGQEGFVEKSTRWVGNAPALLHEFGVRSACSTSAFAVELQPRPGVPHDYARQSSGEFLRSERKIRMR